MRRGRERERDRERLQLREEAEEELLELELREERLEERLEDLAQLRLDLTDDSLFLGELRVRSSMKSVMSSVFPAFAFCTLSAAGSGLAAALQCPVSVPVGWAGEGQHLWASRHFLSNNKRGDARAARAGMIKHPNNPQLSSSNN